MATSKEELALNAARWAQVANKELPKDIGQIFIFFPKDGGEAVLCSNAQRERLKRELKSILKKIDGSMIINPFEN